MMFIQEYRWIEQFKEGRHDQVSSQVKGCY
ncbi:unnamed protein product [Tetraodon nigroviridis]|uniref:(spotted green pufferfish) hypothetical protein n=1 Tax=Tetraodon nigroviridis TaxID=99883 RepID=Q4T5G6_TETNG|nr:unnamed protein product [Tetraodon nigroviridis]